MVRLQHVSVQPRFICMLEHGHSHGHEHGKGSPTASKAPSVHSTLDDGQVTPRPTSASPATRPKSRERSASYSSLYGHPVATRASIVQAAQEVARARSPSPTRPSRVSRSRSRGGRASLDSTRSASLSRPSEDDQEIASEDSPLLAEHDSGSEDTETHSHEGENGHAHGHDHGHGGHGHGHSHGSMNMRALLLHVIGDALGNVGVIATGLVIWLSTWSWKYYFDPMISLVITVIIFSSALPLGTSDLMHTWAYEMLM